MNHVEKSHLLTNAISHPGMKGKVNEDRFAVTAFQLSQDDPTPSLLAVLSDGIGGHRAGEVASEMAVNIISGEIAASDGSQPAEIIELAIKRASDQIFAASKGNPDYGGMGATCAVAWVIGNQLFGATVGDSRIYLIRGTKIYQLSTDHTWIQEALEIGLVTKEEAAVHPNAHIIRRYLGSPEPPHVDLRLRLDNRESDTQAESNQGMELRPGDTLILCSDGLTDLVNDEEINSFYLKNSPEKANQNLVELANRRGGHDNITLVSVQVPGAPPIPRPRHVLAYSLVGLLAFAVLLGVGISTWFWYSGGEASSVGVDQPALSGLKPLLPAASPQPEASQALLGQPAAALPGITATPQKPTLPPFKPNGGGPTLTPWPTNTRLPTANP